MKTRNMKAELISAIQRLQNLDANELGLAISDLVDEISSSRVSVRCKVAEPVKASAMLPQYDASEDGDYSSWLARNNMD